MVASLELRARARRRVGAGGEHSAWWMKRAWLPAVEVDVTLAAMDVVGRGVSLWLMDDCRFAEVSSTVLCTCICSCT